MWLLNPVRPRVFVSYHHNNDRWYYREFSRAFHDTYEAIQDNSVDRTIGSEDPSYVIRRIREKHITGTSCTFVLCGPETRWRKYVDWEIKATLDKQHGLIGINLPNNPRDPSRLVHKPDRLQDNMNSGYALWIAWEDLARGADFLKACVLEARSRSVALIQNGRPLLPKNGVSQNEKVLSVEGLKEFQGIRPFLGFKPATSSGLQVQGPFPGFKPAPRLGGRK